MDAGEGPGARKSGACVGGQEPGVAETRGIRTKSNDDSRTDAASALWDMLSSGSCPRGPMLLCVATVLRLHFVSVGLFAPAGIESMAGEERGIDDFCVLAVGSGGPGLAEQARRSRRGSKPGGVSQSQVLYAPQWRALGEKSKPAGLTLQKMPQ